MNLFYTYVTSVAVGMGFAGGAALMLATIFCLLGVFDRISSRRAAPKEKRSVMVDALTWHYVADGDLPDPEVRCLVANTYPGSDELDFAHHADGGWWDDNHASVGEVYAWAHAPVKPPRKGAAS